MYNKTDLISGLELRLLQNNKLGLYNNVIATNGTYFSKQIVDKYGLFRNVTILTNLIFRKFSNYNDIYNISNFFYNIVENTKYFYPATREQSQFFVIQYNTKNWEYSPAIRTYVSMVGSNTLARHAFGRCTALRKKINPTRPIIRKLSPRQHFNLHRTNKYTPQMEEGLFERAIIRQSIPNKSFLLPKDMLMSEMVYFAPEVLPQNEKLHTPYTISHLPSAIRHASCVTCNSIHNQKLHFGKNIRSMYLLNKLRNLNMFSQLFPFKKAYWPMSVIQAGPGGGVSGIVSLNLLKSYGHIPKLSQDNHIVDKMKYFDSATREHSQFSVIRGLKENMECVDSAQTLDGRVDAACSGAFRPAVWAGGSNTPARHAFGRGTALQKKTNITDATIWNLRPNNKIFLKNTLNKCPVQMKEGQLEGILYGPKITDKPILQTKDGPISEMIYFAPEGLHQNEKRKALSVKHGELNDMRHEPRATLYAPFAISHLPSAIRHAQCAMRHAPRVTNNSIHNQRLRFGENVKSLYLLNRLRNLNMFSQLFPLKKEYWPMSVMQAGPGGGVSGIVSLNLLRSYGHIPKLSQDNHIVDKMKYFDSATREHSQFFVIRGLKENMECSEPAHKFGKRVDAACPGAFRPVVWARGSDTPARHAFGRGTALQKKTNITDATIWNLRPSSKIFLRNTLNKCPVQMKERQSEGILYGPKITNKPILQIKDGLISEMVYFAPEGLHQNEKLHTPYAISHLPSAIRHTPCAMRHAPRVTNNSIHNQRLRFGENVKSLYLLNRLRNLNMFSPLFPLKKAYWPMSVMQAGPGGGVSGIVSLNLLRSYGHIPKLSKDNYIVDKMKYFDSATREYSQFSIIRGLKENMECVDSAQTLGGRIDVACPGAFRPAVRARGSNMPARHAFGRGTALQKKTNITGATIWNLGPNNMVFTKNVINKFPVQGEQEGILYGPKITNKPILQIKDGPISTMVYFTPEGLNQNEKLHSPYAISHLPSVARHAPFAMDHALCITRHAPGAMQHMRDANAGMPLLNTFTEIVHKEVPKNNINATEENVITQPMEGLPDNIVEDTIKGFFRKIPKHEINLLAYKVYDVLEKRISIEKDRRGMF